MAISAYGFRVNFVFAAFASLPGEEVLPNWLPLKVRSENATKISDG
jgi:hypothetical protein